MLGHWRYRSYKEAEYRSSVHGALLWSLHQHYIEGGTRVHWAYANISWRTSYPIASLKTAPPSRC